MVQVTREAAVELFTEIGMKTATKWNKKRMTAKINKLDEMVDKDTEVGTELAKATLDTIMAAIKDNEDVEVVMALEEATPPDHNKDEGKDKAKKAAAKPKTKAKSAPKDPPPTANPDKIPGVTKKNSRPYFAGMVIAECGLENGVTEEMVARLDELYGKENPSESVFSLRNAWHAIRGYQDRMSE